MTGPSAGSLKRRRAGADPRRGRGDTAPSAHVDDSQAGCAARRAAADLLHARLAARPRRRRGDPLLRLHGRRSAQRARRRRRARNEAALRRGVTAARHRRRPQARRDPSERPLPDAQRRRHHRPRPDRADGAARAYGCARDAGADRGRGPVALRPRPPGRRSLGDRLRRRSRSPDEIDTNLVNAGIYILHRDVLDGMAPAGTNSSIEREVFPTLVGNGLYGYEASGYWMDIGTPERYLQATFDILDGEVSTDVGRRAGARRAARCVEGAGGAWRAPSTPPSGDRSPTAEIAAGRDGRRPHRARPRRQARAGGSHVDGLGAARRGGDRRAAHVVSNSVIGPGVEVGEHCRDRGRGGPRRGRQVGG